MRAWISQASSPVFQSGPLRTESSRVSQNLFMMRYSKCSHFYVEEHYSEIHQQFMEGFCRLVNLCWSLLYFASLRCSFIPSHVNALFPVHLIGFKMFLQLFTFSTAYFSSFLFSSSELFWTRCYQIKKDQMLLFFLKMVGFGVLTWHIPLWWSSAPVWSCYPLWSLRAELLSSSSRLCGLFPSDHLKSRRCLQKTKILG